MLAVHRGNKHAPQRVACVARLRDESHAERKLIAGQWYRCPTFCQLKKMKSNEQSRNHIRVTHKGWLGGCVRS